MTALSFGLIASILRMVSSTSSSGVICFARMSCANPRASYDDRSEGGAAIEISPTPIVKAKLDDDILKMSRRLKPWRADEEAIEIPHGIGRACAARDH